MPDIRFYHLTRTNLEHALPGLLSRSLERGWRAVVRAGSDERVDALDQYLWTYDDRTFLPHGTKKEGHAGLQPIWLTVEDENPNGSDVLFLTDGTDSNNTGLFQTVCVLFDGNDDSALHAARQQWTKFKDLGLGLTYWQQGEQGGWQKKQDVAPADSVG